MIPPLDETIMGFGEGRIAKNTWVVNRIDPVQAARDHIRLMATLAIRPRRRSCSAEKAQCDGGSKHDESLLFTHGSLPAAAGRPIVYGLSDNFPADWCHRFHLQLQPDAPANWALHTGNLVCCARRTR